MSRLAADGNIAVADKKPAIPNVFSTLHSPTLSWASVPLLPGTLGMLSGGGFRNSSEVTLVAQDGTEHATPALDASTAALKFKMPDVPGPHLCAPLCISHSVFLPPSIHPPPALHFVRVSSALSAGAYDVRVDGSAPLPVNVPDMCAPASRNEADSGCLPRPLTLCLSCRVVCTAGGGRAMRAMRARRVAGCACLAAR